MPKKLIICRDLHALRLNINDAFLNLYKFKSFTNFTLLAYCFLAKLSWRNSFNIPPSKKKCAVILFFLMAILTSN